MAETSDGEWVQHSEGLASLQMALEYMHAASNQFDVLDSKIVTALGFHLILFTLAFSIVAIAVLSAWVMVAPGIVALVAVGMGMRALRPQRVRQFMSPTQLVDSYREHDYFDHEIAWSLIEGMIESEESYTESIGSKAQWLFRLQASTVALVLVLTISAVVAALT